MRTELIRIFNTLKLIETKGDNTVTMADCLRALADVINNMPEEQEEKQEVES